MSKQGNSEKNIADLFTLLKQVQLDLDTEEMADLLWLALKIREDEVSYTHEISGTEPETDFVPPELEDEEPPNLLPTPPPADHASVPPPPIAYIPPQPSDQPQKKTAPKSLPFKAPTAPGLPDSLELARALRPLMRKVHSRTKTVLDEEKTVTQFVEQGVFIPVLKPAPERWLDLALVVEESRSSAIWQEIIAEFKKITELQGAFRFVSIWSLKTDDNGKIKLLSPQNLSATQRCFRSPKELLDPAGRRLILLISDCTSRMWRDPQMWDEKYTANIDNLGTILKSWCDSHPFAIIQLLPERLWTRTAMGFGFPVQLNAIAPGVSNTQLIVDGLPVWEDIDVVKAIIVPVITLEPDYLQQWSRVVAGVGTTRIVGILFEPDLMADQPQLVKDATQLSAKELVSRFRATASPIARRLAGFMAAAPVSLPVVHLIQANLLKESRQVHIAEVLMSGLLEPITSNNTTSKSEIVQYEFVEGVRELLIDSVPIPDTNEVLNTVSKYITDRVDKSITTFQALISADIGWDETIRQKIIPFARIGIQVLRRLGGEYAELAEELQQKSQVIPKPVDVSNNRPPLQTFAPEVATITFEDEPIINLQPFIFEVATIELKQSGLFKQKTELKINRRRQQSQYFSEDLVNKVKLKMVQIPGGSFRMGAPENEKNSGDSERPQHQVTVPAFFMGKYAVTQAQWQAVASLPQVNQKLKPNPSTFKGANRPVEQVSWYDAVEFCDRLSSHTKRQYRLPSEAEWEYACRAGTTTPFHFGQTITSELANYNSDYTYGVGVNGTYRKETTPVGSFNAANTFGLYDMHGNVWEWCLDDWHRNYEGTPTNGSAWFDRNNNLFQKQGYVVLRGGSWNHKPVLCRSAFRGKDIWSERDIHSSFIGFRVVCAVALVITQK